MKKFSKSKIAVISLGLLAFNANVQANPITTLYNTGVDNTGSVVINGTSDSHYALVRNPAYDGITEISPSYGNLQAYGNTAVGGTKAITSAYGYPIVGPWLDDNGTSAWIIPESGSQAIAFFDYQTTFSLTGFNSRTAAISGQWSTDNLGVDIILNGHNLGFQNTSQYPSWTAFSIDNSIASSYYLAGVNTLDFIVKNDGEPTGLRVEMAGTASPVPVPAAIWMFVSGLIGLGATMRKKAQA